MRILITTDAFPPRCGGSGWSTYELAKGLRARAHEVVIARPRAADAPDAEYDGFRPVELRIRAPRVPFVRNYFRNERFYPRFAVFVANLIRQRAVDVVHAQHVLTGPPSIAAARRLGVPVVCTVRDYWPVCYWSDLIHDRSADTSCPGCSPRMMTRCLRPRAGPAWPLALPLIPYMRANLELKRRTLADADAVVAVSRAIAADLRARAPELSGTRIEIIPNPVDVAAVRARSAQAGRPMAGPYALYVGKLEPNKGVTKLLAAAERARLDWPLVIVGDGSERARLEAEARASARDVRFTGWLSRDQALVWMRHAGLLVFPSGGPESLSRVLLEASALATSIAATDTGGTGDIVVDGETGLLSRTAEGLGDAVARLRGDGALRDRLGRAARLRVEALFDTPVVIDRVEALYRGLVHASA